MPLRKFTYLGPDTDALKKGDIVEQDTQNDTPDGGVPSQYWTELDG